MLQPVSGTTIKIICRFLCVSSLPTRAVQTKPRFNDSTGQQHQVKAAAVPAFLQRENYGALSRAGGPTGTVTPCRAPSHRSCVTPPCHHTALGGHCCSCPRNPAQAQDPSGCPCPAPCTEMHSQDTRNSLRTCPARQVRLLLGGSGCSIRVRKPQEIPWPCTDLLMVHLRFAQSHTQPSEGKSHHWPGFKAGEVWTEKFCTSQLLLSAAHSSHFLFSWRES